MNQFVKFLTAFFFHLPFCNVLLRRNLFFSAGGARIGTESGAKQYKKSTCCFHSTDKKKNTLKKLETICGIFRLLYTEADRKKEICIHFFKQTSKIPVRDKYVLKLINLLSFFIIQNVN